MFQHAKKQLKNRSITTESLNSRNKSQTGICV